jgi:hypothetical protein
MCQSDLAPFGELELCFQYAIRSELMRGVGPRRCIPCNAYSRRATSRSRVNALGATARLRREAETDGMSTTHLASPAQPQDNKAPRSSKAARGDQVISQRLPSGSAMNAERPPQDRSVAAATGVAPASTAAA